MPGLQEKMPGLQEKMRIMGQPGEKGFFLSCLACHGERGGVEAAALDRSSDLCPPLQKLDREGAETSSPLEDSSTQILCISCVSKLWAPPVAIAHLCSLDDR